MLKFIKRFFSQRRFYFKIIFTTIAILGVSLVLLGAVVVMKIKDTFYKELIDSKKMYLQQKVDSIEIAFDQIDNNIQQLIFDPVFDEYINFSRGDYFEYIQSGFTEDEMPYLYKYINLKKEIKGKLKFFKLSHEFVDSIYYYDMKKNIIFTDSESQFRFHDFYDKSWKTLYDNKKIAIKVCLNNRSLTDDYGQRKNVITFIYPLINQNYQNLFVVNIDSALFYKKFIKMPETEDQSEIFVTVDDKVIMYEDVTSIGENIRNIIEFKNDIEGKYNNSEALIGYNTYDKLGWTFVYTVSTNAYKKAYQYFYSIIIISIVLLIFFGSLAVICCSLIIYKPLRRLVNAILNKADYVPDNVNDGSEISLINSTLSLAYQENEKLKMAIDKSMPFFRYTFIHSLLYNNAMRMNIEQIKWQKEFLGIDIELNNMIIIYWEISSNGDLINSYANSQFQFINIINKINHQTRQVFNSNKNVSIEISFSELVCIMNCEKGEIFNILNSLVSIKKSIEDETGLKYNLIVSDFCDNVEDISSAYEKIQSVAWQNKFYNDYEIKYLGDMDYYDRKNLINYPRDIECELLGAIKSGDSQKAETTFREFMKQITLNNNNVNQSIFRVILFRLLSALLNIVSDYELDMKDIIENEEIFYKIIFLGELEAVTICKNFIVKLAEVINKKLITNENEHIVKIIKIIEENYNKDISLGDISMEINLSESYVSRFFKEKTGKTFKEYLNWYRAEKAKELLVMTDRSISEVANDVGYLYDNYFIKVFKGITGITPGDYRKGFRENLN